MTEEGPPPSPEPAPRLLAASDGTRAPETVPIALKLQILTTDHADLLAARSMLSNETFTRAGMYLSVLSGATVALALVAQATSFGDGFVLFALLILPVVLFIGVVTSYRIGQASQEDIRLVLGTNRLRRTDVELAPDLADRFVMGITDDESGVLVTFGGEPGSTAAQAGATLSPTSGTAGRGANPE